MTPLSASLDTRSAVPDIPKGAVGRDRIAKVAGDFETQVLSSMFQSMFAGLSTEAPFGGGDGEAAFRSFLTEAFARKITQSGGVGIAPSVQREMLKLQGLST